MQSRKKSSSQNSLPKQSDLHTQKSAQSSAQKPSHHAIFDSVGSDEFPYANNVTLTHSANLKEEKPAELIMPAVGSSRRKKLTTEKPAAEQKPAKKEKQTKTNRSKSALDAPNQVSKPTEVHFAEQPAYSAAQSAQQSGQSTQHTQQLATLQIPPQITKGSFFIYFIRLLDNSKSDEATYKIGHSNNVPAYRRELEASMPQNVKTVKVFECKQGNAEDIVKEIREKLKNKELRRDWFKIKKDEFEGIVDQLTKNGYEAVAESKAVIKPAKKPKSLQ